MAILSSELKFYKSAVVDSTTANGGVMSNNVLTSGSPQNVFPNVLAAERVAGSTLYRKLFLKVANDADATLINPQLWLDVVTAAADWVVMFAGTQTDTQASIGTPRIYGCGTLKTSVSIGGSALVVTVEDSTITGMFVDGDTIRITDKATPSSVTGNEQTMTISGAPSVSGNDVTITTTETLAAAYTGAVARVMSVYEPSDVECSVDNWVETSSSGTYDESTYPVICDNIGSIEQTWTLTFADATNFTVSGSTVGALASGTVGVNYAPNNPNFTKPYFTLEFAGFGGTWANGDTLVFQTHPAALAIWEKRVVPAGAASLSGNYTTLAVAGESA